MPVCRKHRLVHIHIPKTGGTAIERQFHEIGDLPWGLNSWIGQEFVGGRWYEYQHLSMCELKMLSGGEFDTWDSFAVIRNPYQRVLSDYLWHEAMGRIYPNAPISLFSSLDEFVQSIPDRLDERWDNLVYGAEQSNANFLIHVRPQYQYICNANGDIIVNNIIRYENFEDEIIKIFEKYNIINTIITNARQRKLEEYLNVKNIDIINNIYENDFELFGFEYM